MGEPREHGTHRKRDCRDLRLALELDPNGLLKDAGLGIQFPWIFIEKGKGLGNHGKPGNLQTAGEATMYTVLHVHILLSATS